MNNQNNPFTDEPMAASAAGLIKDTTTASFQADVLVESRKQPVLVQFWAPWCEPCRQLGPVLEKVVQEAAGAVKLVKMNIDDHPSVAGQLGIQSIPAIVAFVNGQPADGVMGMQTESALKEFIGRLGGKNPIEEALAEAVAKAGELAAAGDLVQAAEIYSAVLQQSPENVAAIAGLAGLQIDADNIEAAKELLATVPADKQDDPLIRGVHARLALADQVAQIGDPAALEKRLSENPQDHEARFNLAQIRNAQGNREEAANELLAIMKADREWNEDGARKQLLQFFEAWGPMDPATVSARRKLSSLLFS